jgi:phospholipase/carboxylesterase
MARVLRSSVSYACSAAWYLLHLYCWPFTASIGSLSVDIQSNTQLITFNKWTLRVRPASAANPRLLVLVHGLTGDENSMWVFVRNFSEDYWIIAPRAPYVSQLRDGGYSWWPRSSASSDSEDETKGKLSLGDLRSTADGLLFMIDAFSKENNIQANRFDLVGFSQGGILANVFALLHPERIDQVGILSGFIPSIAESLLEGRSLYNKRFFVAHGRSDEKVKIGLARRSVELLEKAGAEVTFCEDEVGHKVSAHCLRALEEFYSI